MAERFDPAPCGRPSATLSASKPGRLWDQGRRSATLWQVPRKDPEKTMRATRILPLLWPRGLSWRPTGPQMRKFGAVAGGAAPSRRLDLRGIYPPLTTPFSSQGEVDYVRLEENMRLYNQIPFRGRVGGQGTWGLSAESSRRRTGPAQARDGGFRLVVTDSRAAATTSSFCAGGKNIKLRP